MIKKIVLFSLCISLLAAAACADSSSGLTSSTAESSSAVLKIEAPVDENLWNDVQYQIVDGAYIPVPNGFTSEDASSSDVRLFSGPNNSGMLVSKNTTQEELTDDFAKKELEKLVDGDTEFGIKNEYSKKSSNLITVSDKPAVMLSYHLKATHEGNVRESDNIVLFVNGDNCTIELTLSGDLVGSGNFDKLCSLIELPGVKNAKDISFDDVNYVEVDDLMIPIPKSFKVDNEHDFSSDNANIHYFTFSNPLEISNSEMEKEVNELKQGVNEPAYDMYQDHDVHSYKLDFIGGKMAYYIFYTAKIKSSADDTNPTVVERCDIYLNSSSQGVHITLSGDMTKDSNFKAFCDKVKFK